jgi:hypothetical protein
MGPEDVDFGYPNLVYDGYLSWFAPAVRSFIGAGWDLDDLPDCKKILDDGDFGTISHLLHPDKELELNHSDPDHSDSSGSPNPSDSSDSSSQSDLNILR